MKVVAFLPAKGSSSRIDNKNLKLLDGKPLFLHTLEKLSSCDFIDEVYLDSESDEIIGAASEVDCKILRRDPRLASNRTDGNQLFLNEVEHVEGDIFIQALCTSPFISPETIRKGVQVLIEDTRYDSVVLVRRDRQYTWNDGAPVYDINHIPNSVDLPDTIIETMGLYIMRREAALATRRRIGNRPFLLEATPLESVDVNWPEDFALAELIAAGSREKDRRLLGNIKNHLTSCLLSDILDDLGHPNQVIKGLNPNLSEAKLFGRAKTLRLRALAAGEDFKGIYEALRSYDLIVPNDVIVVENEVPDFAYFGELNANLAIRSGASGVIVNGMTRDTDAVRATGLPVFARGSTCQDVRKRATTDTINKTIRISDVEVRPGCLIFADAEGVVVIPSRVEHRVLEEVYRRAAMEKKILADISIGTSVERLITDYGFF